MKKSVLIIALAAFLASCNTVDVFEKTKAFNSQAWASNDSLRFSFDIADTTSFYNVYFVLRHTDAYQYNNMYVNVTSANPGDSAITFQYNFILAKDNAGWAGTALDDIIEQRRLITKAPVRLKKGTYTVVLKQIMRDDPLPHILNAGVRVEKVVQ